MKLPLYAPPGDGASPPPPSSGPPCVTKLVRNYRSHAALLSLPSRLYYGDAAAGVRLFPGSPLSRRPPPRV